MVVGESGLGKSTLLNSLFLTDIYSDQFPGPSDRIQSTVQVESAKILLQVFIILQIVYFGYRDLLAFD